MKDFFDDEEVRRIYYPEVERLVREATGADRVHIFDHTTRRRVPDAETQADAPRQPVRRVHIDPTARSGPQRVRDLLPDEAEELLKGRVQVINLLAPDQGSVARFTARSLRRDTPSRRTTWCRRISSIHTASAGPIR